MEESIGWLLAQASRLAQRRYSAHLAPHGITSPQWSVLGILWQEDGLSLTELARRLLFDGPTMTGIVDRLEGNKLVERRRSDRDRRRIIVYLTESGRGLQNELPGLAREADSSILSPLVPDEQAQLLELLRRLIKYLGDGAVR